MYEQDTRRPGTSPITRASGKKKVVIARFVHNDRLIDALINPSLRCAHASPGARVYYDQLKAADGALELLKGEFRSSAV